MCKWRLAVIVVLALSPWVEPVKGDMTNDDVSVLKLYNSKKYDETIGACQRILAKEPQQALAYEKLVKASSHLHRLPEAITYFEKRLVDMKHEKASPARLAYAYYGLGLSFKEKKDYDSALLNLSKAIELNPDFHKPYLELCAVYKEKNNLDAALTYFKSLSKKSRWRSNAHLGLAKCYQFKSEYDRSLEYINESIKSNGQNLAAYLLKLSLSLSAKRFDDYKVVAGQAEKLVKKSDNLEALIQFYLRLGRYYFLFKEHSQSIGYYEKSLALSQQLEDKSLESLSLYHLAGVSYLLDKPHESIRYLEQSEKKACEAENKGRQAWALQKLGDIYFMVFNDYSRAYDYLARALALHKEINDPLGVAYSYRSIGNVLTAFGELDKAIHLYEKALELIKAQDERELILASLGDVYLQKGDYKTALDYHTQALKISEADKTKFYLNTRLAMVGKTYFKMGEYTKALDYLNNALEAAREGKHKQKQGFRLKDLGDVSLKLGRHKEAERFYHRALVLGNELKCEDIAWEAYIGLGDLWEERSDYRRAVENYKQAISLIESVRDRLLAGEAKTGFFEDKLRIYEQVVDLLLRMSNDDVRVSNRSELAVGHSNFGALAFHYAERAKAQALLQMLPQSQLLNHLKTLPEEFRQRISQIDYALKDLRRQLIEKRTELSIKKENDQEQSKKLTEEAADLEIAIDKLDNEKAEILSKIKEKFPSYATLQPEVLRVDQVEEILKDGELLVEYMVGERKLTVFIVRKDGLVYEQIPIGKSELRRMMADIGKIFGQLDDSKSRVRKVGIQLNTLNRLYSTIFKPIEKHFKPGDELVIVPDEVLSYLPFEMLVTGLDHYTPKYLIERYPISYVYSASLLNPKLRRDSKRPEIDLLAVGNPDVVRMENKKSDLSDDIVRADHLPPLPYAEVEVDRISQLISRKRVFLKGAATENAFKQWAGKSRIIHLAAHNLLDTVNPLYSKIIFAPDSKASQKSDDGFLHMYEICDLKLNADLVVLSGCETGLGRLRRGEGLEGMSRAFLYAGVPSLVASLWQVADSDQTPELMARFYTYLIKGMDKRKALQKAKLDLIAHSRSEDPFYWAPLILIGDTTALKLTKAYPSWLITMAVFSSLALTVDLFLIINRKKEKSSSAG